MIRNMIFAQPQMDTSDMKMFITKNKNESNIDKTQRLISLTSNIMKQKANEFKLKSSPKKQACCLNYIQQIVKSHVYNQNQDGSGSSSDRTSKRNKPMFPTNSENSQDLWAEEDLRYDKIGRRSFGFVKDAKIIGMQPNKMKSSAAWMQQSIIEEQVM